MRFAALAVLFALMQEPAAPAPAPTPALVPVPAPAAPAPSPDKPMHVGGPVKAPKLVHYVDPDYSKEARKAKINGVVQVYLQIETDGSLSHLRVVKSAGYGLDEEALKAVSQYRFRPATRDGVPVRVELYVNVNFQMSERR